MGLYKSGINVTIVIALVLSEQAVLPTAVFVLQAYSSTTQNAKSAPVDLKEILLQVNVWLLVLVQAEVEELQSSTTLRESVTQ
jgi:hypothetical protein